MYHNKTSGQSFYYQLNLKLFQETEDVVSESQYHESYQQDHSHRLGCHQELVARLPARNHLIQGKEYVSSVQGRNREYVQNGKHD